ncbi:exodeoxyribonuclease III, partial [Micromonospora aurantiaca]|nr:exodeoxyribonuclease III [Micromonospora aurantiaca]
VAVLSRVGIEDVSRSFPGEPVYEGEAEAQTQLDEPVLLAPEARAIGATCGGTRVWSLYAPNGRTPDSAHYLYKLAWFAALRDALAAELSAGTPLMATGDY